MRRETDWRQIRALYGVLYGLAPSPVVALNRAIALRYLRGPAAALAKVDALSRALDQYHLYHASRAELLHLLDREEEAHAADCRAMTLTTNPAEHELLARRLAAALDLGRMDGTRPLRR